MHNGDIDQTALRRLAEDFPGWYFWRAKLSDGAPKSWMATRIDTSAGVDPTLMEPSVEALRKALDEQRRAIPAHVRRGTRTDPRG